MKLNGDRIGRTGASWGCSSGPTALDWRKGAWLADSVNPSAFSGQLDAIAARHAGHGRFRVNDVTYGAGEVIRGASKQAWLYVLSGSCRLRHADAAWELEAGQCLECPAAEEYLLEVCGGQACRLVWVWDLSLLDLSRDLPDARLSSRPFDQPQVEQRLFELGWPVTEAARSFWQRFGGLRIETRHRPAGEYFNVLVDPLRVIEIHSLADLHEFESKLGCELCPVALTIGGEAMVVLGDTFGMGILDGMVAFEVSADQREGLVILSRYRQPAFRRLAELED